MKMVNNKFIITQIFENSPASEAGLKIGDTVVGINGIDTPEYDLKTLQNLFKEENKELMLLIERNGQKSKHYLTLRQII